MRLDGAMKTDVARARSIIVDMLGPTVIEDADDEIYAQMYTGPALRIAAGANVDGGGGGCGGPQCVLATSPNQGLSATVSVQLGDRMLRRRPIAG